MEKSNLPYFPMYPDDFTGDIELMSCSLEAIGLWTILMMRMHRSPIYGKLVLLKQNSKQTPEQTSEQTSSIEPIKGDKLARIVGRSLLEVEPIINELLDSGVMKICPETGAYMSRRMVKDHAIRMVRKAAGSSGGKVSAKKRMDPKKSAGEKIETVFASDFAQANSQPNIEAKSEQNTGIRIVNGNGIVNNMGIGGMGEKGIQIPKPKRQSSPGTVAQSPPELILVKSYWCEYTINRPGWTKEISDNQAESWYDSMVSKGWKVGSQPMKDWRAASRTGIKNCEEWGKVKPAATQQITVAHKQFSTEFKPL